MLLLLLKILRTQYGLKLPAALEYVSTRLGLAALTSLILSIFLGPYLIHKLYEWKIGQPIRMEECPLLGELHKKKKDTPTMGGVLIIFSMTISLILWMDLTHSFTLILLLTTYVLGAIGAYDDYLKLRLRNSKGLSARSKFSLNVIFSILIASYLLIPQLTDLLHSGSWFVPPWAKDTISSLGAENHSEPLLTTQAYMARLFIPFFKEPFIIFEGLGLLAIGILIVFVITGTSNAVNLTDGLDGLAAGCVIMVASTLMLFAFVSNNIEVARYLHILYIEGSGEIAVYLAALIGGCLGFLWYNGHPAQIFMGDTGSLALGGVIGVAAILLRREPLLALIGGIFVAEAMSDILQVASYKLRNKKRIFLCAPLHHHFEYKGWPETKVVMRFWIVGLILAIIGLISLKLQ
ncbi:MAG: mraY [Chlamydiales bacterium]|jgi:phospho-N-acetylmuramoyl-pentapeptide-transferase|nr:mraY [Chlamydiales bacterium]